ncbi:patatin-like phospholipase family protein [Flavobacterium psychrotrophum]|uniref:patatin-like phospholipase family protein n=1 Tax=Flavobacterium psychrotrophum TaxID=2294119 RepID=UPI000E3107C0|nr:patatin-like phospholipase family protein [Flavobacterium psychrotrophum]
MENKNTFHAGICMAGAISAGAYTAGVVDYLIEALEHWEKAKQLQAEEKLSGIPQHNFLIEVLGGASAGGMTAAITAAGLQQDFKPVNKHNANDDSLTKNNPLYNAWVNLKEAKDIDMMSLLLNTDDIENDTLNKKKEVRAGFNSNFIRDIASDMLDKRVTQKYQRPYIAKDLDVFTTLTNLRGFSYEITFKTSSGDRKHRMRMHRDYAFFKLDETKKNATEELPVNEDGTPATAILKPDSDGRIPVHFNAPDGLNTEVLKQAAMGTGAFPVGLESRNLIRGRSYIENSRYLNLMKNKTGAQYSFLPDGDFESLNVDGGVINNEPYEITESLLEDRHDGTQIATSAKEFNSVVLMIDPFPNDEDPEPKYVPKKAWRHVLPSILGAMRSQLMMKDEQIKRAYLDEDYTRFLIMPERYENVAGTDKKEKYAIACGSLGGFGGFFSKEFRKHDYLLGRRNCQRFLQHHFTVPQESKNPILEFGYKKVDTYGKRDIEVAAGDTKKEATLHEGQPQNETAAGTDAKTTATKTYLCIVPDIRIRGNAENGYTIETPKEEEVYDYPSIRLSYILGLKKKIIKRLLAVAKNITNSEVEEKRIETSIILKQLRKKSVLDKALFTPASKLGVKAYAAIAFFFAKGKAADTIIDTIIRDMEKRGLIKDEKR